MAKGGSRNRAGRPPTPTEIKVLTGTFRSDRHGDEAPDGEDEVKLEPDFPQPPEFLPLSDRAKDIWMTLGQHCGPWTTPSDWVTVWGLVRLIERLVMNQEAQNAEEEAAHPLAFRHTITEHMGERGPEERSVVEAKSNPLVEQEIKLFDKLRPYIAMLGFSPIDRTRMPKLTSPDTKADPLKALMNRARA